MEELKACWAEIGQEGSNLMKCLFGSVTDVKKIPSAIGMLAGELENNAPALLASSDLFLKWCTLVMPSDKAIITSGLIDLMKSFFVLLQSESGTLMDFEAAAFIPYLCFNCGQRNARFRQGYRDIMCLVSNVYPLNKYIVHVLEIVKDGEIKNVNTRAECTDELRRITQENGHAVLGKGKGKEGIMALSKLVDSVKEELRKRALDAIETAWLSLRQDDQALFKMGGKHLSEKGKHLVQNRLKTWRKQNKDAVLEAGCDDEIGECEAEAVEQDPAREAAGETKQAGSDEESPPAVMAAPSRLMARSGFAAGVLDEVDGDSRLDWKPVSLDGLECGVDDSVQVGQDDLPMDDILSDLEKTTSDAEITSAQTSPAGATPEERAAKTVGDIATKLHGVLAVYAAASANGGSALDRQDDRYVAARDAAKLISKKLFECEGPLPEDSLAFANGAPDMLRGLLAVTSVAIDHNDASSSSAGDSRMLTNVLSAQGALLKDRNTCQTIDPDLLRELVCILARSYIRVSKSAEAAAQGSPSDDSGMDGENKRAVDFVLSIAARNCRRSAAVPALLKLLVAPSSEFGSDVADTARVQAYLAKILTKVVQDELSRPEGGQFASKFSCIDLDEFVGDAIAVFDHAGIEEDAAARVKDLVSHVDESRHDEFVSAANASSRGADLLRILSGRQESPQRVSRPTRNEEPAVDEEKEDASASQSGAGSSQDGLARIFSRISSKESKLGIAELYEFQVRLVDKGAYSATRVVSYHVLCKAWPN